MTLSFSIIIEMLSHFKEQHKLSTISARNLFCVYRYNGKASCVPIQHTRLNTYVIPNTFYLFTVRTSVQFTMIAASYPCKSGWQNLLSKKQNAFLKVAVCQIFLAFTRNRKMWKYPINNIFHYLMNMENPCF